MCYTVMLDIYLSIGLFVSRITEKVHGDLAEIFREG